MIQVLKRVADIMEYLSVKESGTLAELSAATGLKKTTQYAILSSLVKIGYLEKTGDKKYILGQELFQLTYARRKENAINELARETVSALAEDVKESVVAAIISGGERCTIATAAFKQELIVDTTFLKKGTFYSTATGRMLLAGLDRSELGEIVKRKGLPGKEWPETHSYRDLEISLERIRKAGIAFELTETGEVQFLAVPVFGPGQKVWAAIGISMPSSRFKGKNKNDVIDKLKSAGKTMSDELLLAIEEQSGQEQGHSR